MQSALVGNGRLLVALNGSGQMMGLSWPTVDSPTQFSEFTMQPLPGCHAPQLEPASQKFDFDCAETVLKQEGKDIVRIGDRMLRDDDTWLRAFQFSSETNSEVHVSFTPTLDGRGDGQTVFYDSVNDVTLAYHRNHWVGIGSSELGTLKEWQCVTRKSGEHRQSLSSRTLSGQRIASRQACGADLKFGVGIAGRFVLVVTFGNSRERVLSNIARARNVSFSTMQSPSPDLMQQSANVIRLLSNRDTGAVLAGPPLPVDIPSEPGYASVWARDAAYTLMGCLAINDFEPVRHFLDFAFRVQCPEGIWMHRHHSDYSVGSSWGLHQLDETGSVLHLLDAYCTQSGDWSAAEHHWDGVYRAAEFLVSSVGSDNLPIPSVDLWEELESKSPYTTASVIGGLRSAANIAQHLSSTQKEATSTWLGTSDRVLTAMLDSMWSKDLDRFHRGIECRAALDLSDDDTRPPIWLDTTERDRPASAGFTPPDTPLVSLPNSTSLGASPQKHDSHLDVSVLGLVFPFAVLSPKDPRILSTLAQLRATLWNSEVGGYGRYEGDTYGGGNSWPVATLWVACCLTAMDDTSSAKGLLDWVGQHTGPNNMVAEQVHKTTGEPLAALPMAWSHGMIMVTDAAIRGKRVWETDASKGLRSE